MSITFCEQPLSVADVKMRFKVILVVFELFIVICSANSKANQQVCGKKGSSNGANDWPWLVAFRNKFFDKYFFGGSLISARHVISAAHGFPKWNDIKLYELAAIVGKNDFCKQVTNGSVEIEVLDVFLHKDWDNNYEADISIILLEKKVDLTQPQVISIVCLPPASANKPTGGGIIAGWEISKWNGECYAVTPSELELPIVSNSQCLQSSNQTFCAGSSNKNEAVCQGDSSGGFYKLDETSSAYNLAGIVSASSLDDDPDPCRTYQYSVFTDVSKFIGWIETKMTETMENKMKEIDFECYDNKSHKNASCSTKFDGPYNAYLKIRQQLLAASDINELDINFEYSDFIFAGIGENFPKLKELQIKGMFKKIEKQNFVEMEKLEKLNLENNKINFLTEDVFSGLVNLKELGLGGNQFESIPEKAFLGLVNLIELKLDRNRIENLPEKIFSGLVNLKNLQLNRNRIENLPEKVFSGLVNLKELKLGNNHIRNLPEKTFSGLVNLKILELSFNKIQNIPEKLFSGLVNLEELLLLSNKIQNIPEKLFSGLVNLKDLLLVSNEIQNIPEKVFSGLVNLKELWLIGNFILYIPENAFSDLVNLETLDIGGNRIKNIYEKSFSGLVNLKILRLNYNQIQVIPEKAFSGLVNLNKFWFFNNQIQNIPEKAFSGLVNLKELWLHNNQIQVIPEKAFSNLVNLETLKLEDNMIRKISEKTFSGLVNLKNLQINENAIEEISEKAFSSLVKLEELRLYRNGLNNNNIDFSMNPNLKKLYNETSFEFYGRQ